MPEPIRILHVFGRMGRGGGETRTLELMRRLDRQRYQFEFCTLSEKPGELDDEIIRLGGQVHPIPRGSLGFSRRFKRLLREGSFQIVYSHVLYYSGYLLRLAAACEVPTRAVLFRNSYNGQGRGIAWQVYRRLMRHWIDRYATHILAVGQGAMAGSWGDDWRRDPRCRVIHNGLDLTPFETAVDYPSVRCEFGIEPDVPVYIHVGRMMPLKNHVRLVSIFREVLRRQPRAKLLLVGRGGTPIERDVRRQVVQSEIDGHVVFCGERNDVPRLLQAADAMLFPSRWEGLPGAVLEASASGIPVLASDLPGTREIAARLPDIQCLSLDVDNTGWAKALDAIYRSTPPRPTREEIRRRFSQTEFTMQRCLDAHCRIWDGAASLETEPTLNRSRSAA